MLIISSCHNAVIKNFKKRQEIKRIAMEQAFFLHSIYHSDYAVLRMYRFVCAFA